MTVLELVCLTLMVDFLTLMVDFLTPMVGYKVF